MELPIQRVLLLIVIDYDGDSAVDMVGNFWWADSSVFFLWLSGSEHDPRTRPFDSTDVDLVIEDAVGGGTFGYIGDSLRRYQMLPISEHPQQRKDLYGLGGGKYGPNLTYDLWLSGSESPLVGGSDANDVNGDQWLDRIMFSSSYGGPGVGIAAIFSGGPYIPTDDTTLSVRSIATEEHEAALHIWPNPVIDELHIAWRGGLQKRPSEVAVYDMRGREVVRGEVNYWRGEAVWECGSVASGAYLLVVYDNQGAVLASEEVIVQ